MDKPDWKSLTKQQKEDALKHAIEANAGSASQIAGAFENCTRNSIIGRAHRSKILLPGRIGDAALSPKVAKARKVSRHAKPGKRPTIARLPQRSFAADTTAPLGSVAFADAGDENCKWPLWDDLPFFASTAPCCGLPTEAGRPYCLAHNHRSTQGL